VLGLLRRRAAPRSRPSRATLIQPKHETDQAGRRFDYRAERWLPNPDPMGVSDRLENLVSWFAASVLVAAGVIYALKLEDDRPRSNSVRLPPRATPAQEPPTLQQGRAVEHGRGRRARACSPKSRSATHRVGVQSDHAERCFGHVIGCQ
jgi:hypothetical protein